MVAPVRVAPRMVTPAGSSALPAAAPATARARVAMVGIVGVVSLSGESSVVSDQRRYRCWCHGARPRVSDTSGNANTPAKCLRHHGDSETSETGAPSSAWIMVVLPIGARVWLPLTPAPPPQAGGGGGPGEARGFAGPLRPQRRTRRAAGVGL